MAKFSSLFAFIYLLVAGELTGMVDGKLEQVMKQGDRLRLGFKKDFQYGKCRVAMKARGSLVVLKQKKEMTLTWQTGLVPGHVSGDEYVLQLREKGNMVIQRIVSPEGPREKLTVYDTHTEGDVGDYFLGINQACALEIHKGAIDKPGELVWSNIKWWMVSGDILGMSEIFSYVYDACEVNFMFMNPNGNLEIYEGRDFASAGDNPPVWESNTKRQRGDYQFRIDENAVLSLHDVATGEEYWRKDLQNSGHPPTIISDLYLSSFPCDFRGGVGPYAWFQNEDNVFMREGDRLPAGSVYNGPKCGLFVQYDGRLDIDNWLWFHWSSGKAKDDTISDEYFLMLHETGNLAMYRGTIDNPGSRLWATHTKGEVGNYFLSTDENCYLEIFKGTPEESGELVWSSHVTKLGPSNRLIKAQYFTPPGTEACGGVFMALRPDNGVLGVYSTDCLVGSIYEKPRCFENPKWSFDAGLSEYDDFYMEVNKDGKLSFYGVGEGDDKLMDDVFDLGDFGGDFEVALCDENNLPVPNAIVG